MTKTIVIGASFQDDNKPIVFNDYLDANSVSSAFVGIPSQFKYIELICKNYNNGCRDLMFAYNDPNERSYGELYIGHFNDGIVK
jgi:hypothetical protein